LVDVVDRPPFGSLVTDGVVTSSSPMRRLA
jgi:hypothetical protein